MAENLMAGSGTLAKASQTVETHRAQQSAIAQRVQSAAADSQSGWQGQGAAAVAQVVQQYGEDNRRIDQALANLSSALKSTDQSYSATEAEAAAGAQRVGANSGGYHNLPA